MKNLMFGVLCLLFLAGTCFGNAEIPASSANAMTEKLEVDSTPQTTIPSTPSNTTESIPTSINRTEASDDVKTKNDTVASPPPQTAESTQISINRTEASDDVNTKNDTVASPPPQTAESTQISINRTEASDDVNTKNDTVASPPPQTAESTQISINRTEASDDVNTKNDTVASPPPQTAESTQISINRTEASDDVKTKKDTVASPPPQTAESTQISINRPEASDDVKTKKDTVAFPLPQNAESTPISINLPLASTDAMNKPNANTSPSPRAAESTLTFINPAPPLLNSVDESEEIYVDSNPSARDASSTPIKNKVIDKIKNLSYNNSLLITNWLNLSSEKSYVLPIGEPFDLSTLHNWTFENTDFGIEQKIFNFTNITADRTRTHEPGFRVNKFSCQFFRQLQIDLDVTPEELLLKSQIHIIDKTTSKTAQGSFTLDQTGSRLLYKIPYFYDVDLKKINLSNYVHFKFDFEQIKVKHSLGGQIDIYVIAKDLYNETEGHILRKIDNSIIFKKLDQVNNAFPFMSTCLSPPAYSKPNYFVINTTSVKKYKSHNLELGPLIIRGFDKLASSSIIANRSSSEDKSLNFSMVIVTERLYGQCDWKYYKDGQSQTTNYSFTFTIENATFFVNPEFHRNWSISNHIDIKLSSIKIHRLDKSCPKIYEFTKDILRQDLRYTIITTLKEIFYKQYGKPNMNSNQFETSYNIIVSKNASKGYDIDESKDNDGYKNYIPFPTRRVAAACTDKRNWFVRLFSRKKC